MLVITTTTTKPKAHQIERAKEVAHYCNAPFWPRRGSLERVVGESGASIAYVVGQEREWLQQGGQTLFVNLGMLATRRAAGHKHPLIKAIGPASTIIDSTLGLAADALHISAVLGARIVGIEGSPPVCCLLEEGLSRLAIAEPAAKAISLMPGPATEVLPTLAPADVVFVAPMFSNPKKAPPGYALFRQIALHTPFTKTWLDAAIWKARSRVVLKVMAGEEAPDFVMAQKHSLIRGKAVDYFVILT
ncbi:MAG: class I SAM-dependent methyltransferase [Proteobacteria bacterium]|jgi:hypothetical protein|nr:class I SAM-dependent methyltransferase [Pseudomonadota bacterium]